MAEKKIPGTLYVYGTAAEESEGAKVFMAREGVFDDLDAVLPALDVAIDFSIPEATVRHAARLAALARPTVQLREF